MKKGKANLLSVMMAAQLGVIPSLGESLQPVATFYMVPIIMHEIIHICLFVPMQIKLYRIRSRNPEHDELDL